MQLRIDGGGHFPCCRPAQQSHVDASNWQTYKLAGKMQTALQQIGTPCLLSPVQNHTRTHMHTRTTDRASKTPSPPSASPASQPSQPANKTAHVDTLITMCCTSPSPSNVYHITMHKRSHRRTTHTHMVISQLCARIFYSETYPHTHTRQPYTRITTIAYKPQAGTQHTHTHTQTQTQQTHENTVYDYARIVIVCICLCVCARDMNIYVGTWRDICMCCWRVGCGDCVCDYLAHRGSSSRAAIVGTGSAL